MAQQLGAPANVCEFVVAASSDGNGVEMAYAVRAESPASAAVLSSQIDAVDRAASLDAMRSEFVAAGLVHATIDRVSGVSAEAVALPLHAHAEDQPSVTGAISAAPFDAASLVGGDVVASAVERAMAQQLGAPANDFEVAVAASSDGSGMEIAYAVRAESAASAAVLFPQIDAVDLVALLGATRSEFATAGLVHATTDRVSSVSAEAVVLPLHVHAEGQPSVTGTISAASSDAASLVGNDAVASALVRAMAQHLGAPAYDLEVAVAALSDGSGVEIAYAVRADFR